MGLRNRVNEQLNEVLPITEEQASVYGTLGCTLYAIAGVAVEQSFEQVHYDTIATHPKEFAAKLILGALAAGSGSFFLDRAGQSRGE
jgi:hypothetical protein